MGSIDIDGEHGRKETRTVRASSDIAWLKERHPKWEGLTRVIAVIAKRKLKNKITEEETRYFISRLNDDHPDRLGGAVRGAHWSIKNKLHGVLDIAFDEGNNRTRKGYSAVNLAVIRYIALNLL